MNLEPFYALCNSAQESDRKWAMAFCETLDGVFDDGVFMDIGKVCRLFYGKSKGLSKAQYYRKKKFIIWLYQWLLQEGYVSKDFLTKIESLKIDDVVSEDELSHYYFGSLESAIGYISQVGNRYAMDIENDLLPVKAIVILTWYQVDLVEMTLIKKTDLNEENHSIQIRGENPRVICLDDFAFTILKRFADALKYHSFPGRTQGIYQSSIYLFRSNRADRLNEDNLKCFCKRFNASANLGKLISLLSIHRCGIFYQVLLENNSPDQINTSIQKLAHCDRQIAFGYAKLYMRWKQKFYNDEVLYG